MALWCQVSRGASGLCVCSFALWEHWNWFLSMKSQYRTRQLFPLYMVSVITGRERTLINYLAQSNGSAPPNVLLICKWIPLISHSRRSKYSVWIICTLHHHAMVLCRVCPLICWANKHLRKKLSHPVICQIIWSPALKWWGTNFPDLRVTAGFVSPIDDHSKMIQFAVNIYI